MNDKDSKYREIAEVTGREPEYEERKLLRRASIAVILIVLLMVAAISTVVYFVELSFGRTAGTVVLVIIAAVIAAYLYRKEIAAKFKRK